MIGRCEFITLIGGAAVGWPLAARAQQPDRMRRIGVLMGIESDPDARIRVAAFQQRLRELGWSEERARIEVIWGASDAEHVAADAADLLRQSPDVIVTNGPIPTTQIKKATHAIPVVFVQVPDPVDLGIVTSIARPAQNITGFMHFELAFGAKWLEVLKEIAPQVRRVLAVSHPDHPALLGFMRSMAEAGSPLGVDVTPAGVRNAAEVETRIEDFARAPEGGLIVLPSPIAPVNRDLIVALAARHRLPTVYPFRWMTVYGGLLSYGIDTVDLYRRTASYVDRILKGEKPADLPVQAPTKYELVINLKTAKALGLEVPPTLLARADEVIE